MKRCIVRIGLGIVMGGLLSGGLLADPAMANLVTFDFKGAVSNVQSPLFSTLNTGQTLEGSFTFNDATLDAMPARAPGGTTTLSQH